MKILLMLLAVSCSAFAQGAFTAAPFQLGSPSGNLQGPTGAAANTIQSAIAACKTQKSCSIIAPPTYSSDENRPCVWNNIGQPASGEGCSYQMDPNVSLFDFRHGYHTQNVDGAGVYASSNYQPWSRLDYVLTSNAATSNPALYFASKVGFNNNMLVLNGGVNINQNGYPNKTFYIPNDTRLHGYAPGQKIGYQAFVNSYGVGDALAYYGISTCYGGFNGGSDEGCEGMNVQATQATVEYSGVVSSVVSNQVSVSVREGDGTQGVGRYLMDVTQAIDAGTIAAISGGDGRPVVMTGHATNWPVSSVNTTTKNSVREPGLATVNVAAITGITVGSKVCIADPYELEQVVPTAISGSSFTAVFRYPHAEGAIVAAGGLACHYISLAADTATAATFKTTLMYDLRSSLHWVIPVIRSLNATSIEVWLQSPNSGFVGYRGRWTPTNNAYSIYPGAQVTSVMQEQKLSNTLTLEAPVSFAQGDSVILPMYHNLNVSVAIHAAQRLFPQVGGANPAAWWMNLSGLWTDTDTAIQVNNSTPQSIYAGGKTQPVLIRPAGVAPQPWGYFVYTEKPPTSSWLMSDNTTIASNVFTQSSPSATGFLASRPAQHSFAMANYSNPNYIAFDWLKGNIETSGTVSTAGLTLTPTNPQPPCSPKEPQSRGLFWFVPGPKGAQDHVQVCAQNSSGILGWQQIY